ncbi:MAG: hypothetical protein ACKVX7_10830 [Planctomycetota bacterium]
MRRMTVTLTIAGCALTLLLCASRPEEPSRAQQLLAAARAAIGKQKNYAFEWRCDIGLSDSADHAIDFVAFLQAQNARVYDELLAIPDLELYRLGERGALRGLHGWQSIESHYVGKYVAMLMPSPEAILAEAARETGHEIAAKNPPLTEVSVALAKRVATKYWERVVQSRALAGPGEDIPKFLARIDGTRVEGRTLVSIDTGTGEPREIVVLLAVGLTGDHGDKKRLDEQEHLVVRSAYLISEIGKVAPITVPEPAQRFLRKP